MNGTTTLVAESTRDRLSLTRQLGANPDNIRIISPHQEVIGFRFNTIVVGARVYAALVENSRGKEWWTKHVLPRQMPGYSVLVL